MTLHTNTNTLLGLIATLLSNSTFPLKSQWASPRLQSHMWFKWHKWHLITISIFSLGGHYWQYNNSHQSQISRISWHSANDGGWGSELVRDTELFSWWYRNQHQVKAFPLLSSILPPSHTHHNTFRIFTLDGIIHIPSLFDFTLHRTLTSAHFNTKVYISKAFMGHNVSIENIVLNYFFTYTHFILIFK